MSDVIVVGAGVAGLAVALRLAQTQSVTLVCKAQLGSGTATAWAQGGIAAAIGADDSPLLHADDTCRAGGGLNVARAVEILTGEAAARVADLIGIGAQFDRMNDGSLALGHEAAHSRRRVLHAGGDATGREVHRTLLAAVQRAPITFIEAAVEQLIVEHGRVTGVIACSRVAGDEFERIRLDADAVVLATGGCGGLYSKTTNPPEASGDGIALAARAGAELVDLEFVQFHPTAFAVGLDPMPLLTEALRGEGARLVEAAGDYIMAGRDPRGDLAPRDVVARAVFDASVSGRRPALDVRGIANFNERFPTVFALARTAGLDPAVDLLPVEAAAHFHMGGVSVDETGRTTLPGLWACGETASTGAHGANRLASNSLSEALVFAARVADDIGSDAGPMPSRLRIRSNERVLIPGNSAASRLSRSVRELMYRDVGVIRDAATLSRAVSELGALDEQARRLPFARASRDMILVGRLIAQAAAVRCETRGSHQRRDYPLSDPAFAQRASFSLSAATVSAACSL